MKTTCHFSSDLVHRQRRSYFEKFISDQPAALLLLFFLTASHYFQANLWLSLMQFSFKWLLSLQYQYSSSRFKEPSTPGTSCVGCSIPKYGLQCIQSHHLTDYGFLLAWFCFILRLLLTAWLIASTDILESKSLLSFWFWASKLLIIVACCLIYTYIYVM